MHNAVQNAVHIAERRTQCSGASKARWRAVVKNFQGILQKRAFVKDTSMRRLFDMGALVVSIHGQDDQQTPTWWPHISYANLRTLSMTIVPMQHLPAGPDARAAHDSGCVLLRVPEGHLCQATDLHRFFSQVDLDVPLYASFYYFVADSSMVAPFLPRLQRARKVPDVPAVQFWFGKRRRRAHDGHAPPGPPPLPPPRGPHPPLPPGPDQPPLGPGDDGDDDGQDIPPGDGLDWEQPAPALQDQFEVDDFQDAAPEHLQDANDDLEVYESSGSERDQDVASNASDNWDVSDREAEAEPQPAHVPSSSSGGASASGLASAAASSAPVLAAAAPDAAGPAPDAPPPPPPPGGAWWWPRAWAPSEPVGHAVGRLGVVRPVVGGSLHTS